MKICVISDIHSNVFALRTALANIDDLKPDKIICLGDIVGNGAYPEETIEIIRKRPDVKCVGGNHDFIVTADLDKFPKDDIRLPMFRWQSKVLSGAAKQFLGNLKRELRFWVEKKEIVCFHYPKYKNGRFKNLIYMPNKEEIKNLFADERGDVFLFGHEHTGSFTEIDGKYYLNFGTLGNLLEKNIARYGIVNIDDDGIKYELRKVSYDDSIFRSKTNEILNNLHFRDSIRYH